MVLCVEGVEGEGKALGSARTCSSGEEEGIDEEWVVVEEDFEEW